MAKSTQSSGSSKNPLFIAVAVGVAVALVIAIAIFMTRDSTGDVVSSGPETETIDLSEELDDVPAPAESEDVATESDDSADAETIEDAAAIEEAVSDTAEVPMVDGEQSVSEGDGETPGGIEPDRALSGSSITPDDTDGLVTPTGEPAEEGSAVGPIPGEDEDADLFDDAETESETDLDTSIVVDPDEGQEGEPDGGADPFYPTPSGPEGSDDNPLTAD